jgi:ACS family hexuronate transporter-like MFS transporter
MAKPYRNLRWIIGGGLFLSTVINYIDRQTLSVLAPYIKEEYKWTNTDFAWLISAFRVAYSVGQAVAGRFLHRMGTAGWTDRVRGFLFRGCDADVACHGLS